MKKIFILILAFCMVLPLAACGSNEKKTGGEETPNIKAWTMHSFEKTIVNIAPNGNFTTEYTVYLAKGETEGCQVAIYSDIEIKNIMLTLKSGENEYIKPAMFSLDHSHKIGKKYYTDSTVPYYGRRINLEAKTTLPFMVEFTTTADTPAGEYEYVYEIKDRSGKVYATYNITVHVWDFALPEEKTFATSVGIRAVPGYNNKTWYDAALEHNMSAYHIPYDLLSNEADEYMSNPRVTSFIVNIPMMEDETTIDEEKLLAVYNKLLTNEEWLKKAFFLPLDEPHTTEQLVELREWERKLTELCPRIEIMAPIYTNIQVGEGKDQIDDMAEYTDLWCPKLCLWDDVKSYDEFLDYTPSKTYHERMDELIASGDRMWSYVCNDPVNPYSQLYIDTDGVNQRLLFWQMYQRDIDGFLYWGITFYGYKEGNHFQANATLQNPWETVNTKVTDGNGKTLYGEGFLFYPGRDVGLGGAVPSIRAKIVRDGVDDIEMLYLAEKYLDKDWIMAKTLEGTPTLTEYSTSDEYVALRIEIGNALEAALKGN